MKKVIVFLYFNILAIASFGQALDKSYKTADVGVAAGNGFLSAFSFTKMYGVGKTHKFKIGYGVRLSNYFGKDLSARTAPASLTSGKASIAALVSDDIVANIDTFQLKTLQTNSLNLSINLQYALSSKVEAGINIDAIGFSFGGKQSGSLISKRSKRTFTDGTLVSEASPTSFNALLISDSDLGSLNSEVYARYWLTEKIGIRAGLSFIFSEYTTTKKVAVAGEQNDRWRYKGLLPLVAISFKL